MFAAPTARQANPKHEHGAYLILRKHLYCVEHFEPIGLGGWLHVVNCKTEYPQKLNDADVRQAVYLRGPEQRAA